MDEHRFELVDASMAVIITPYVEAAVEGNRARVKFGGFSRINLASAVRIDKEFYYPFDKSLTVTPHETLVVTVPLLYTRTMASRAVSFEYTNWRGERRVREVIPDSVWFGSNEWHKEPQWLLKAFDVEDGKEKSFSLKDIRNWQPKD